MTEINIFLSKLLLVKVLLQKQKEMQAYRNLKWEAVSFKHWLILCMVTEVFTHA